MEILLVAGIVFTLFAIGHLLYMINTRRLPRKAMYWFWVILLTPVIGAVIYFTFSTKDYQSRKFRVHEEPSR